MVDEFQDTNPLQLAAARAPGRATTCSSSATSCSRSTASATPTSRSSARAARALARDRARPRRWRRTSAPRPEILERDQRRLRRRCTSAGLGRCAPAATDAAGAASRWSSCCSPTPTAWDGDAPGALGVGLPARQPGRQAEARLVAQRVAELVDDGGRRAGDIVVLLRAATDMAVYERAIEDAGPADARGRRARLLGRASRSRTSPPTSRRWPTRATRWRCSALLASPLVGAVVRRARAARRSPGRARAWRDARGTRVGDGRRWPPRARGRRAGAWRPSAPWFAAERERAPRLRARRAARARRRAHRLRPARPRAAAAARGGWPTSTSCMRLAAAFEARARPRRARLHRPRDRRARGRGARARRAGRARRPRRRAADDDPRRQGPRVPGRRRRRPRPPAAPQPRRDLLVDGDRVGLRLVGLDGAERDRAGLRRARGRAPRAPTRPRSGASCTSR